MLRPVFAVGDKPREDERSCCASSKEGMRLRFRRLIFVVSRTLTAQMRFSQLTGRACKRPSCVFPGRYGLDCGKTRCSAEFGAWLRRPARVGFRTYPDGLEGPAYSVSLPAATVPAAPRRARGVRPRWPRRTCRARRRAPSRPPARREARGRRRRAPPAACRWRTCRPRTAWARS